MGLVGLVGCDAVGAGASGPHAAQAAAPSVTYVCPMHPEVRTEDPEAIVHEVASGAGPGEAADYFLEVDRRRAIERVVQEADDGDVVVIMGKGHEAFQLVGGERLPFDDRAVAVEALERRRGADG